nr:unnamed protein product [Digitaria exilis]
MLCSIDGRCMDYGVANAAASPPPVSSLAPMVHRPDCRSRRQDLIKQPIHGFDSDRREGRGSALKAQTVESWRTVSSWTIVGPSKQRRCGGLSPCGWRSPGGGGGGSVRTSTFGRRRPGQTAMMAGASRRSGDAGRRALGREPPMGSRSLGAPRWKGRRRGGKARRGFERERKARFREGRFAGYIDGRGSRFPF